MARSRVITGRLVPLWAVTLVLGERWWDNPAYTDLVGGAVRVGGRIEIDTGSSPTGGVLVDYLEADRLFAEAVAAGEELGPWVVVRRTLGTWHQGAGTRSAVRGDLTAQFQALGEHPETSGMLAVLLAGKADPEGLAGWGQVSSDGSTTVLTMVLEGRREWESALGGAPWTGEIERELVLTASHAKWRDRQVRRLVEVEARAVEIHVDPTAWTERTKEDTDQRELVGVSS